MASNMERRKASREKCLRAYFGLPNRRLRPGGGVEKQFDRRVRKAVRVVGDADRLFESQQALEAAPREKEPRRPVSGYTPRKMISLR